MDETAKNSGRLADCGIQHAPLRHPHSEGPSDFAGQTGRKKYRNSATHWTFTPFSLDLKKLSDKTVWIDCDVLQADGGTRTASITGAWLATRIAVDGLMKSGKLEEDPILDHLAAISVGIYNERCVLDLDYPEDRDASVDANIVMTGSGTFVEVQSSGEEATYTRSELEQLLVLAEKGIMQLIDKQKQVISG